MQITSPYARANFPHYNSNEINTPNSPINSKIDSKIIEISKCPLCNALFSVYLNVPDRDAHIKKCLNDC
jgi:hypothetical protein